jgi:long-chain acyl-CoA synthetase
MLEVLRAYVVQAVPSARAPSPPSMHWTRRWWRHLDAHRLLGAKFWCAVVGAAPLDSELESFWSRLGFLIIQGYGLTETAPVVTLNHPFAAGKGSVGKPIAGVEVKLAPDGEVLVRGGNVTRGYYNDPGATDAAFEDGWLKTGDIGELTPSGHLRVKGRKKEVIVNPDGTNVFPSDVERVLDAVPGVREAAVVGVGDGAREAVHAVLVVEDGVDLERVVAAANAQLAPHQRIRSAARWPGEELPRTEGTRKLRRVAVREWAAGGGKTAPVTAHDDRFEALFARHAQGRAITPETTMDDLGLTSLDRVELMVALEQHFSAPVDEQAFASARTLGDLRRLVDDEASGTVAPAATSALPTWNTSLPARLARRVLQLGIAIPAARLFAPAEVTGLERLAGCEPPVIFAANHQSHLDTPSILAALPPAWRFRVAPAMLQEYFAAYFHPEGRSWTERFVAAWQYWLAATAFAAFPLPQREAGSRESLRHMGTLASKGYSLLIFPEGMRTDAGEIRPFQPGVGMMAARLALPVVPVRLEGLERVWHKSWNRPRRGRVRVTFGAPLRLDGQDFRALAAEVERAVRSL